MQIQLTISLLASDRGQMLKRCLASIRPLLLGLPSELIIVYTGKSEEVLQIAKEYTDIIIPFTWCNDFSAARNAGLEKARGEWFLYLDDDEWFEDVEEILQFFQTGEYKSYHYGYYMQRNYTKSDGSDYANALVGRMTQRMDTSRFQYCIHEQLTPVYAPVKYFSCFVHHYGYCTSRKSAVTARNVRNIALLKENIEKNPLYGASYAQLAQTYNVMQEYKKAEEYCRKGRDIYIQTKTQDVCQHLATALLPEMIRAQGNKELALQTGEEILSRERPCELVTASIAQTLVRVCVDLREYKKGKSFLFLFHKMLVKLCKNRHLALVQQAGSLNLSTLESASLPIYMHGLVCALHEEDEEDIRRILQWLPWEQNGKESSACIGLLESVKETNPAYEDTLVKCCQSLDIRHSYITFQKALYAEKHGKAQQAAGLFQECIHIKDQVLLWQLLEMAVRNHYDASEILQNIELCIWEDYVDKLWEHVEIHDEAAANRLLDFSKEAGLHGKLLYHKGLERAIRQDISACSWLIQLAEYVSSGLSYYEAVYNKELFTKENEYFLPGKCRFLRHLSKLVQFLEDGRYSDGIPCLSLAVQAYPKGAFLADRILRQIQRDIQRPAPVQGTEFQTLGVQLKAAVESLIEQKQFAEALPIIQKLLEILPEDLELLKMKQKILRNGL